MSSSSLLEIHGITKSYPGVIANEDVKFTIKTGEIHALLGENGAGKSTLLKLLSKEMELDSGSIAFEKDIRIGFLRQDIDFDKALHWVSVGAQPTDTAKSLIRQGRLTPDQWLERSEKEAAKRIARAKKGTAFKEGKWRYGASRPCTGCASCINEFGIPNVVYTDEDNKIIEIDNYTKQLIGYSKSTDKKILVRN